MLMDYKNKKILVLGAGTSGIGAAHVLQSLGANVILNDYQAVPYTEELTQLEKDGVTIITGSQKNELLSGVDRIIASPGISLSIPILEEAKKRHIEVTGEVELAFDLAKGQILGITGTNGKTTTTMLVATVMRAAGKDVRVGGNIGTALSEVAYNTTEESVIVAELSSYQLESILEFRPQGAIILNITPDHLQRHKTMEAYQAAKENIFKNQTPNDVVVLNYDDEAVKNMATRVKGKVCCISQNVEVTDGAYFKDGICYAVRDGHKEAIINQNEIKIPGRHNIENILAVIALSYTLGIDGDVIKKAIASFSGVEHRLELVATSDGVTYYNDSKATNTDSAEKALEAFAESIILLAGGYDKMTDLTHFMQIVKQKVRTLILMGAAANRFKEEAEKAGIEEIIMANSMQEAIEVARNIAKPGEIVLLSPACSSFDWYTCFEERGDDFKKRVLTLLQKGH